MCPRISSGQPRLKLQLQEFRKGELVLNSCDFHLVPKVADSAPIYAGPGTVAQTPGGRLELSLFCLREPDESDLRGILQPDATVQAGDRMPDSSFHVLHGPDIFGQSWSADYVLVDPHVGPKGIVVSADLSNLSAESELPTSHSVSVLWLGFKSDARFPVNKRTQTKRVIDGEERLVSSVMDRAVFSSCGYDLTLYRKDGWIILAANTKDTSLPPSLHQRIREALQFVLDEYLVWSYQMRLIQKQCLVDLRPFPRHLKPTQAYPPIRLRKIDPRGAVWDLFEKYLQHVIDYEEEDHLHPLFTVVRTVVAAEASPLEAQALSLSIAVEGILKTEFGGLGLPPGDLAQEIDIARELLACSSDLSQSFKNRIEGFFGAMLSPSTKDRLMALVEDGAISEDLVDAWDALRHRAAHASLIADGPKSVRQEERLMKRIREVRQLFHELVFLAIDYTGPYNDYSTRNWPAKDFQATLSRE